MSLSSGSRLGPYEVVRQIGAGGMGVVYHARDSRLQRDVALKVLPEEVSQDRGRQARFAQEARSASALNHPNIICIHDIGRENGISYIVSELVDGESLRHVIARGPMPIRKLLDLATQIAEGLAAANSAGILHRDLKPENIMVTRTGRVKILDFGLAKQTRQSNSDAPTQLATEPGVVMGTVGYMSPEQVRAAALDLRSDIFSFGVILYEMASGKRPFKGDSPTEVMHAILKEDPPEIDVKVLPGLDRIIRRCLEKDAAHRFQNTADLAFALQTISGPATAAVPVSRRPQKTWKWPVSALALGCLAVAVTYWATTRTSTKAQPVKPAVSTNPGRSTAAITAAPSSDPGNESLRTQHPPAKRTELPSSARTTTSVSPEAHPTKAATPSPSAARGTSENNRSRKDNDVHSSVPAAGRVAEPTAPGRTAEALPPTALPTETALCTYTGGAQGAHDQGAQLHENRKYSEAIACFSEAIRLKPAPILAALTYQNRALSFEFLGQYERAIQDYDAAIRLKPDYAGAFNDRGTAYNGLRQYELAIRDFTEAIRLLPNYSYAFSNRGFAYSALRQYERAILDFNEAIRLQPDYARAYNMRGYARDMLGDSSGAAADRKQALELRK